MNNLAFNSGFFLNNFFIDSNDEFNFKNRVLEVMDANELSIKEYNGYTTYSFLCVYLEMNFRFYITFHQKKRNSDPYLVWLDSICEQKKWESSEKDLHKDVENLKKKLEENGFLPYKKKENLSFYYIINETNLVLTGSLRSMSTIIGIEM
jgi:hypothetical protein